MAMETERTIARLQQEVLIERDLFNILHDKFVKLQKKKDALEKELYELKNPPRR